MAEPIRIAMWSGPRNISTAMMRAWGNRDDTIVIDEPLYAYYLRATDIAHPGADEVIATGENDWRKVVAYLTGPVPNGKQIFFQKQKTHHLLPEIDREWIAAVTNCFLIRDPREVISSYIKKREDPALEDLDAQPRRGLLFPFRALPPAARLKHCDRAWSSRIPDDRALRPR